MKITVDLKTLHKNFISADEYIFLYLLVNKHFDKIDEFRVPDLGDLEDNMFIKITGEEIKDISVRIKGQKLFSSDPVNGEEFDEFIKEYRELFPVGVKSGGYPVRGDKQGCTKKMIKFMKEHPKYTRENIIDATTAYIDVMKKGGYAYMKLAHYYIDKDGASMLASMIEDIADRSVVVEDSRGGKTNL